MNELEQSVKNTFQEVMRHCKAERRAKTKTTTREIASLIGKTENYVSSIENGREFPSLKTFLAYLHVCGFDLSPLRQLTIDESKTDKAGAAKKAKLVDQIYSLNNDQVEFLAEQLKVAEVFRLKAKK